MMPEPTPRHILLLGLCLITREEVMPILMKMFKEQKMGDPELAYAQAITVAADLMAEMTMRERNT